jgi:hypothetical protein
MHPRPIFKYLFCLIREVANICELEGPLPTNPGPYTVCFPELRSVRFHFGFEMVIALCAEPKPLVASSSTNNLGMLWSPF